MDLSGIVIVPISAIPAQRFQVVLNNQNCVITIKKRGKYSYFSLMSNGNRVADNVICLAGNNLVPYNNQYFSGSLMFIDKSGHYSVPKYELFGTRYKLVYVPFRLEMGVHQATNKNARTDVL